MRAHGVEALLMGGQACILYGAAEFSRDADFAVLASPENLDRLTGALGELQAEVIAVPPFDVRYLERGHAIHFRCRHPDAPGMRVDVMARLRGVDPSTSFGRGEPPGTCRRDSRSNRCRCRISSAPRRRSATKTGR